MVTGRDIGSVQSQEECGTLHSILDFSPSVVYVKDTSFRYAYVNSAFESHFGLRRDEIVGKTDYDLFPGLEADTFRRNDERVLSTGEPLEVEEVVRVDAETRVFISAKFPILDSTGTVYAVGGVSTDITGRVRDHEDRERLARRAASALGSAEEAANYARREAARLSAVFQAMANGIVIYDAEGRIAMMNGAAEQILGYDEATREMPIEKRLSRLRLRTHAGVPVRLEETPMFRALHGESVVGEMLEAQMDAGSRWLLLNTAPVRMPDGSTAGAVVSMYDMTERHAMEERQERLVRQLAQANEDLTAVAQVTDVAVGTLDLDELLCALLERLASIMHADTSILLLREGNDLVAAASHGIEDALKAQWSVPIGEGFAGGIAVSRRPMYLADAQATDLVKSPHIRARGVRTMLGAPIISGGDLIGVLHVDWLHVHPEDSRQTHLLEIVADRVGLSVVNARLFARERQTARLNEALARVNAAINSTLDFGEIMQRVQEIAAEAMGAGSSGVLIPERGEWVTRYVHGAVADAAGRRFRPEEVPSSEIVVTERRPLLIPDTATDERVDPRIMDTYDVRSMLVVPLIVRGEVVGVIDFNFHERPITFDQPLVDFSEKLATSLSLALENARLLDERERSARLSDKVNEIASCINSTLDVEGVMPTVLEQAARTVSADSALVLTQEDDGGWRAAHLFGLPEDLKGRVFTYSEMPYGSLTSDGAGYAVVDDARRKPGTPFELTERVGVRSVLDVPLRIGDEVFGGIALHRHGEPRPFDALEVDFARKVGATVSQALRNARLYERERDIAETLQESLLMVPERLPGIDYATLYRSATVAARVGGDFFDIFELEHERVGIIIGDVSGKGVGAAALTTLVDSSIKAYAYQGDQPKDVLRKVNDAIERIVEPSVFVSVFYAALDIATGALDYVNAGHPLPMMRRSDGRIEELTPTGPVIGVIAGAAYEGAECHFGEGDVLVLFTDGIVEARHEGEQYGVDRLERVVAKGGPVRSIADAIFDDVSSYTAGALADDVAIMTVSLRRP